MARPCRKARQVNTTTRRYPRTLAQAFPRDYAQPIEHHRAHRVGTWAHALVVVVGCVFIGILIAEAL